MKMKIKKNKLIIMTVCILLLLNFSLLSTLAWMSDSEELVNTFTVGKVDIILEETDVDEDGDKQKNEYHLIPGQEYDKDPTMTVVAGSEESYLRMILTVHNASAVQDIIDDPKHNLTDFAELLGGWDEQVWLYEGFTEDKSANTISFEFRYKETVDGFDANKEEEDVKLDALFKKLLVPGTLTIEDLAALEKGGFKMVIEGHAIQAAGFENDDEAWAAFAEEEKAKGATNAN